MGVPHHEQDDQDRFWKVVFAPETQDCVCDIEYVYDCIRKAMGIRIFEGVYILDHSQAERVCFAYSPDCDDLLAASMALSVAKTVQFFNSTEGKDKQLKVCEIPASRVR